MTTVTAPWSTKSLAELGGKVTSGSRGWAKHYSDHGDLFVRITNLSRESIRLDLSHPRFVDVDPQEAEALRTRLAPGDLLVSITADIGIIGYVDESVPSPAYINQHIARVRLHPHKADSRFVAYYLSSWAPQRAFVGATDQGAKAGMNLTAVADLVTAAPPVAEQSRIAEALSDADDMLSSLGRILAKKQAIKQGMMQQLLSGRTRLPGFSDPWSARASFEDLCTRSTGFWGAPEAAADASNRVQVITAGDITPGGRLRGSSTRYFTNAQVAKARCLADDLVITSSGNGLGKTAYIQDPGSLAASNFVRILRPRNGVSGAFLAQVMRTPEARALLDSNTATSAYPNLMPSFFAQRWIPHPSSSEQLAIAAVLREADAEIEAVQARREKAIAIKTGMMQQLLTGRTRLPVETAA